MSDPVIFKLTTGQEIIGKVSHVQDGLWFLDDVRDIVPMQADKGIRLTLAPFIYAMMGENERVLLHDTGIIARAGKVPDRLLKDYLASTSRIMLAGANDIK